MKLLNREELEALNSKREIRYVDLTEFGLDGGVYVRSLLGAEANEYIAVMVSIDEDGNRSFDQSNMWSELVIRAICDADGKPYYKPGDEEVVGAMPPGALRAIHDEAAEISGINQRKEQVAENLNEAPGDSPSTP